MTMRKNSGFTLFELLAVIGIVAVLSAIAIPNFFSWLPKYRLGSAARNLLSAMQYARLVAVKENVDILVNFDPQNDNYMLFPDYNSDEVQDGDEPTLRGVKMPGGVSLTETNFTGDRFKFNSRGLASGSGGTISLTNNLNTLTRIRINRTGNSRILADDEP
jgi:type IV fimbrial biogenesis protein FimT